MFRGKVFILVLLMIFMLAMQNSSASSETITSLGNTDIVTNMPSYSGFVNHEYTGDVGTRLYILPRAKVTNGIGGGLKIFGDPFHLQNVTNFDYRDLGIYFYQNQNGDKGTNETGVFWFNGKVMGPSYNGKNPDIAFGFQDGKTTAARMSYHSGASLLTVGEGLPHIYKKSLTTKLEMHGDIGFRNNDMIRWVSSTGYADSGVRLEKDDSLKFYVRGTPVFKAKNNTNKTNQIKFDSSVAVGTDEITNPSSLSVQGSNVFTIDNTKQTTLNSINYGTEGQEVTLIFKNGQTTVQNNDKIKLKDAMNFVASENDTLKLVFNGEAWYEVSRSLN